ncbi:carbohydrate ABC transporter permease [Ruania alba]|uniref:sn-glycerol 3-phosphate transport system permease protein n=1 Tax=Ruania alba TaxID=648782 RepID=A0A1H5G7E9_9MICO|nr:sugar ABC transporter permease [Ruania alba]SEE11673.1 sn-glycerol 3-phosphate transport system permease protein [Ruania alba]
MTTLLQPIEGLRPRRSRTAVPQRTSPQIRRRNRNEGLLFWALILPNLVAIVVFGYYPTVYNFVLSFTDWDFVQPAPVVVGLDNYEELFQSGSMLMEALRNTAIFVLVAVIGTLFGGMAIGALLAQRLRFSGLVRTIAFAPHMLPGAAIGVLWLFMFDPNYGLSRWLFSMVGMESPSWTTTSDFSLWAITIAYAWQRLGFVAIIYYTAILDLPKDIYEAAALDGARGWGLFRYITLPLLSPVTFFLTVTGIIAAAQTFDIIATLTNGGPGTSSTTLPWMIYDQAFVDFNIGTSAATATVMFALLLLVTLVQTKYASKQVHYS